MKCEMSTKEKNLYSLWGRKFTKYMESLDILKSKIGVGKKFLVLVNTTSWIPYIFCFFMVWGVCPPTFPSDNKGLGEWGSGLKLKVGRDEPYGGTLSLLSPHYGNPVPYTHGPPTLCPLSKILWW